MKGSCWIILNMINILENVFRDDQNTRFMLRAFFFFRKTWRLLNNEENYCRAGLVTHDNIICRTPYECWIDEVTNSNSEYVILNYISNATMVSWQCLKLRWYVHYLPCITVSCTYICNVLPVDKKLSGLALISALNF